MEPITIMKYSAEVLGAFGWIVVLITMYKHTPMPFRNLLIGGLAVVLIALPLGEKLVVQVDQDGLKFELGELEKKVAMLSSENDHLELILANVVGTELATLQTQVANLSNENLRLNTMLTNYAGSTGTENSIPTARTRDEEFRARRVAQQEEMRKAREARTAVRKIIDRAATTVDPPRKDTYEAFKGFP